MGWCCGGTLPIAARVLEVTAGFCCGGGVDFFAGDCSALPLREFDALMPSMSIPSALVDREPPADDVPTAPPARREGEDAPPVARTPRPELDDATTGRIDNFARRGNAIKSAN